MKKILISLFVFSVFALHAQEKIAGAYHVSSGNPDDGGYNWMLFEDHRFAMFTFGQVVSGKWSSEGNEITFVPNIPKENFAVYGRFSQEVKGSRVMFSNFDINEDSFFGNSKEGLRPVLVENANCLPFPLVENFKDKFQDIILSSVSNRNGGEKFYSTAVKEFNDFMIIQYPSRLMIPPFTALYKDKKLYFDHGNSPSTEREDIKSEEMKEIEPYLDEANFTEKESLVINKAYNIVSRGIYDNGEKFDEKAFLEGNYRYDSKGDVYVAKEKYEVSKDDEYHDYNLLYKYHLLNLKPAENIYSKSKKSIFNITCHD